MTSKEFMSIQKETPFKRGFYQNSKGAIRWLHNIQLMGSDVFIIWASKKNALATLRPKHKGGLSVQGQNVNGTKVADWFISAKYIGGNVYEAGLVEKNK
ncbi:hypothetical protein [Lactiplantibacillus plantarum]|uniref:hypothetical protein n=1 Tax=Lactiplantibacillus plantarum TaxID=1590 RepID=UPI000975BE9A|nr:hypothetical protein [Lactiplantibacillus plantarum]